MELLKPLRLPLLDSAGFYTNTKALLSEVRNRATFDNAFVTDTPTLDDTNARRVMFKLWWAYYENYIYANKNNGGYRNIINEYLENAAVSNIAPLFNPVERAVRAYEYVFDGLFGEAITIDDKVNVDEDVNKKILEPIRNIWKWSGINGWKNDLLVKTAALGSCGLRITYNQEQKRVYLIPESPALVRYIETDPRGNITQIVLEYDIEEGNFYDDDNPRMTHHYVEYMSRDIFWMTRDGGWWNFVTKEQVDEKEDATIQNVLGVVPYVIVTQSQTSNAFGLPCFAGHERQIDHINALAAHINQQIRRHVTVTWFIQGGGDTPETIDLGDQTVLYTKSESGTPAAQIQALVSNLSLGDAIQQQNALLEELTNSIPEMKATDGQFLSHQSGGTVAQLRLPAEQRILSARTSIEQSLIKAQKIALSYGVLYNNWDLGSGMGTREAADAAFNEGLEDHRFAKRPALPLTVDDKLQEAKAEQAKAAAQNPNTPGVKGGDNTAIPSTSSTTAE